MSVQLDNGIIVDMDYPNPQKEYKEVIFETKENDKMLIVALAGKGGESGFDNVSLRQIIPPVANAYVYNGGYIAIKFTSPLENQATFTMYINGEKRGSRTFGSGTREWRDDIWY
ncbi:hypothetical protein U0X36_05810 [Bacillus thuringiensis]|uniref:hypothetical protein n=1 Tax=Bacillus thuringiensis TaxID=1428 RepID=UPI000E47355B|nr:hypothetical protein [Bacillus thuringiensis]MDZ3952456.1 hypothetical protein [Bacillus thuringiensis]RGP53824.1 hypothetical protein BTW32_09715 [Bacillus thuringiensis]